MGLLSKINSAKVYEYLLWLSFLVITFFIGFFHGSSPEKQINFYYQDIKKIDVLVHEDGILRPSVIKYIEKETHTQINLVVRKSYKDFRTEIIVNRNLHLILNPEAFIEPLFNDNRIKNIEPLAGLIAKHIHSDFQPSKFENQIYSVPISWFVNVFLKKDTTAAVKNAKAAYLDYLYLLNQKKRNHYFQFTKNFELVKNWTHNIGSTDAFETTLQLATLKKKPYEIDTNSSFLITYSLSIPNATPDRRLSMDLLKLILLSKDLQGLLVENNLGQTFLEPKTQYSVAHFIAPESIRNLNLKNFKNANKSFDEPMWSNQLIIGH
ncbi:MAG: hypothetical protein JNM24_06170 [Bdellovibrionaceae bacterium]|nr:hypothetical protein [Pseudobdellovibrionaceae bacterium]